MAVKSLVLKSKCSKCGEIAVEKSRLTLKDKTIVSLQCGHFLSEDQLTTSDYSKIVTSKGFSPRKYQIEGIEFAERSGARCLIGDEQGLGKTVQASALLRLHGEGLFPAVVVTKTSLKTQWMWELMEWTESKKVQVLQTSKDMALPGFDIYVITYDILKSEKVFQFVQIRTIVLDEVQAIKNHLAGRAKAVQMIVEQHKIEHILGLSGTAIKNNAGEYFTILNLLRPMMFPSYERYLHDYCDTYEVPYGRKVGGLRNPNFFFDQTKDFIIRRTKNEVLKDLPSLQRNFHHVELNKEFNKAYDAGLKELEKEFYSEEMEMTSMIAIITKLRQITGASKVTEAVDFVTDFLLSTDRKITVFVHHHLTAGLLEKRLNEWMSAGGFKPVLNLHSGLNGDARAELVRQFKDNSDRRVLIASTLAAGEGLNLQFCSDAIMLERQWNPANEEQAEARFHRFGQKNTVNITYMIASETIDEYFTELVEQKRAIVNSTLDNKEINWEQSNLMMELAQVLLTKNKKSWRL